MVQRQIWYFVLYSWSLPCPCLQPCFSFFSQTEKTFHFFFVVKYLCSDLMLHQFSCLFLDFLIPKIEVSKWCDLKLVSASGILHEEGSHPVGISLDLVWDVFLIMKTPFDSWRMLRAVKSSTPQLTSWTSFFQSWVSEEQPDNLPSARLLLIFSFECWACYWSCGPRLISATFHVFSLRMHKNEGYK